MSKPDCHSMPFGARRRRSWLIALGLMVIAGTRAGAQEPDLVRLRDEKLTAPFLKTAKWFTDYDLALAAAKPKGAPPKLIFAWCTRSYAPIERLDEIERQLLLSPAFTAWAADYVLFAHVTSLVKGDKHQDFVMRTGGRYFPHVLFLDSNGTVLGRHEGYATVSGLKETAAQVASTAADVAKWTKDAAAGNKVAKLKLLRLRLDFGAFISLADVAKELAAIGATPAETAGCEKAIRAQTAINDEAWSRVSGARSAAEQQALGLAFLALVRGGQLPRGRTDVELGYWGAAAQYAASCRDIDSMEMALTACRLLKPDDPDTIARERTARVQLAQWTVARTTPTLFVGDTAPPLASLTWLRGDRLARLDPTQTYVIELWASQMDDCTRAIPVLTALAAHYKPKGVTFIGISVAEQLSERVGPFVSSKRAAMGYAQAYDGDGRVFATWLRAAGLQGVPTAYVVLKSKIVWIGHSLMLAKPLEDIANGRLDVSANAREIGEQIALGPQLAALSARVTAAYTAGKLDDALRMMDAALAATPALEGSLAAFRFQVLLDKGELATAFAYGAKIVDGCIANDPVSLNQVAWLTVDPSRRIDRKVRDFKLARKASERSVAITAEGDGMYLDTLALLCFEVGERERALELQEKAVPLAAQQGIDPVANGYTGRLAQYRRSLPKR